MYENYVQKRYIVNRRYQRKLVWSIAEKEAFIDSVYRKYSVPLFLFAQPKADVQQFEIIDGMQRLNAIFCFIENEFGLTVNGKLHYFDLETLGRTKKMREDGILSQKQPILDRESCISIMNYELPLTTVIADTKNIEEIFRRINSYGRQLSNQEIRQAGALGLFPDLVRRVSAKVRGDDSSKDIIGLNDMNLISLSNGKLRYGININKVFWVKEKIITLENMRKSRDEELVAQLLAYMIVGENMNPSKRSLDGLYHYEDDDEGLSSQVERGINRIGAEIITSWFERVYSDILLTIHEAGVDFCTLLYGKNHPESVNRIFQVVFLAFFELLINKNMMIADFPKLVGILQGCGPKTFPGIKSRDNWTAKFRAEKVKVLMALIESAFVARKGSDVVAENWTLQIDNLLRKSSIEGGQFDFKIGFHDFAGSNCIHMVGGISALIGAAMLGPRIGKFTKEKDGKIKVGAFPGHNLALGALGVFILWLGWYGFNGAAATSLDQLGAIFVTTTIAPSIATVVCMIFTWIRYGKPDVSMCLNASLAGLVAITAPCDVVDATGAIIIGAVSGVLVVFGVWLLDYKLRIDDPVGAVAVHMMNGIWGTIAVGLFATNSTPTYSLADKAGNEMLGVFYGGGFKLLGIQALGMVCTATWTALTITLAFFIISKTIGLRVTKEEEILGLDATEHGLESAYAGFVTYGDSITGETNDTSDSNKTPDEAVPIQVMESAEIASDVKLHKVSILCKQSKFEALKEELNAIGVTGITVTQVLGCGAQKGHTRYYRGVAMEMNLLPKVKVEVIVSKVPVSDVIRVARKALYTGNIGDGKIFVYNVADVFRIRTGATGYDALQDEN